METKVKHVRDAAYWGMPVGTPIEPGMKPVRTPRIRPKRVSSSSSGDKTPQTTGTIKPVADKPDAVTPAGDDIDLDALQAVPAENFSIPSTAQELSKISRDGRADGAGTPSDPIDCGDDVVKAQSLLLEGKHVRLNSEVEVSILIDKVAEEAAQAKKEGRDAPDYNFCAITIPGTSLFCTDESVEMMTARGWKRYDDLVIGEPVLTIDHTTGLSHWEPLQAVNVFPAEKRTMLSIEGSLHSSLTTLDHRWAVLTDKRKGGLQRNWRTSETLKWDDKIPLAAPCVDLPTEVKYTDDLVALVAWAWTEGTISRNRSLRIYQSEATNQHHVARIRATLTSAFGKARVQGKGGRYPGYATELGWYETTNTTGVVSFHLTKAASDTVLCHMDDQKIVHPEFLTALTESQLRTFVDISVMADGCVMPDRRSFGQRVEGRARAFEQACALLGIPTHTTVEPDMRPRHQGKNMYRVALMTREVVKPYNLRMQRVEYDGLVWCPTTPNGTWLARRNGSVYITGNCEENKGIKRDLMPQFGGQPVEGSFAEAKAEREGKDKANVMEEFALLLKEMGIDVEEKEMPVQNLKATQNELVGSKVAGIRAAMRKGMIEEEKIYVTRDGYVVDGHHRWAAKMALDLEDGKLGDVSMGVKVIDADIGYALDLAIGFTKMAGIKPKGTGANAEGVKMIDVSEFYFSTINGILDLIERRASDD